MRPHPENFDRILLSQDLVDESMLDIDSPREGAFEISDKLFVSWRTPEGILREEVQKHLSLLLELTPGEPNGVALKIESRSRIKYLGAVSNGNASRSCSMTQAEVGLNVALKCSTRTSIEEPQAKLNPC